jgi:hypothetical protein
VPLGLALIIALAGAAALMPAIARRRARRRAPAVAYVRDPARDARAERRARELLRSVAGDEVAEMYERLGFVGIEPAAAEYGYLVYPHRPIVAYDARSDELLSEYCVRFPDRTDPAGGEWLPDADDVLAKWLALRADEAHLVGMANMHLPGRQLDPRMVRRDLAALRRWREEGRPQAAS